MENERFLWVRGDTFRYRQEIRDKSGFFDRDAGAWRLPWSQRFAVAIQIVSRWHGCTLHTPTPEREWPRPESAFVRLRLVKMPLVLNAGHTLPVLNAWYDVEEVDGLCCCHPLVDGARQHAFFLCLAEVVDAYFESQV